MKTEAPLLEVITTSCFHCSIRRHYRGTVPGVRSAPRKSAAEVMCGKASLGSAQGTSDLFD